MPERHFVQDYRSHVAALKETTSSDDAMQHAVGGSFDQIGKIEVDVLREAGLKNGLMVVDVGCGSGRLAIPLSRSFDVSYCGTDVVPDLLDYARRHTPLSYQYILVDGLKVPLADRSADIICAFSVFTHLLQEESFIYLRDMQRALKKDGVIVFSFLEFAMKHHWSVFEQSVRTAEQDTRPPLNMFMDRVGIAAMARHLGLNVVCWMDAEDGTSPQLGQSVGVLRNA